MDVHWETVTPFMRQVMRIVGESDLSSRFYLAGGTALALQLGHRRSIDLDFFSETDEVRPDTHRQVLRVLESLRPQVVEEAWGNLLVLAHDLHVGFFGYGYPLIAPFVEADKVHLASVLDIGLMKLDAVATRASRKDFYDLYVITERIPLRELIELAPLKYPSVRDYAAMVTPYLVFFDRAEEEEPPQTMQEIEWEAVKVFFREQAVLLAKEWLE